jgi:hypothetical protein
MKCYILHPTANSNDSKDYKIVQVKETDEASFLADHGHEVLVSGDSIQEVIIRFGELVNGEL